LAIAISIFIGMPIATAEAPELPKKHLIPYMEADGNPNDYSRLVWLSPTRVAFTANKDGYWEPGRFKKQIEVNGDIQREHLDAVFEILIFDTETGKTTHYRDGWLSYLGGWLKTSEDIKTEGITIELERVRNKKGAPWTSDLSGAYDLLLKGPMGSEKPETRPLANPRPLKRCPNNPDTETVSPLILPLKAEHGCLQFPDNDASPEKHVVYFRKDGKMLELNVPRPDISAHRWIEWLGAYLLSEDVIRGANASGHRNQVVPLMKPDGKLLIIPMNEWDLSNVRPTRAGMVVSRWLPDFSKDLDGIYLWGSSGWLQLAEGYVKPGYLEVSPDGCHVAYFWKWRYAAEKTIRLRVIDVCRGMGVSADANPFNW
jgi:hypothetical protein